MDSNKMKQRSISAFFGAPTGNAGAASGGKTQQKISNFFGGKPPSKGPDAAAGSAPTPEAGVKTADPSLTPGAAGDAAPRKPAATPPADAAGAKPAPPSVPPPAKTPVAASGSAAKPRQSGGAAGAKKGSKGGNGKTAKEKKGATAGSNSQKSLKRLRRVVQEDDGGEGAAAGLEDELEDEDAGQEEEDGTEGSEYEGEDSGGDSEDESLVDEEDESSGGEEEDGGSPAAGKKRKRPAGKAAAAGARTPSAAAPPAKKRAAAAATPLAMATPEAAISAGRVHRDTPLGTASKGPASAKGGYGYGNTTTGKTAATPASGAAGSGYGSLASRGAGGGTTPCSVGSLRSALSEPATPSRGDTPSVSTGVGTTLDAVDAERFAQRMAGKLRFLLPDRIKDAQGRRPDHPDYDPRTLFIPPNWFKEEKVSEGQQQWWSFKAKNFDSVLLFKMGKFYEMFEMDAFVGVDVLGLQLMRGDQPHAGFPEIKYASMAETLARAGLRVVVVEQTETPEMMEVRNKARAKAGLKKVGVVDRQKVAVLSRGTLVDAEMVASRPDASYAMAVFELPLDEQERRKAGAADGAAGGEGSALGCCEADVRIGLCAVDTASGQVLLGEFVDDEVRSGLRTQLTALQPVELVLPRDALSTTTARVLRVALREPRLNKLAGDAGEWSADKSYRALRDGDYFALGAANEAATKAGGGNGDAMDVDHANGGSGGDGTPEVDASARWPAMLRRMVAGGVSSHAAAMGALGGMITFLKDSLLDKALLPLGRFDDLPAMAGQQGSHSADEAGAAAEPQYLHLNGASLESLEILENSDGGATGTLLSVLDHCTTPFGRRRLRQWLCRPLGRIADITARQDAVADLMGPLAEAAGQARKLLAGVSDLERALARLHASTVAGASGRDASNVVLYEDAGKRKVAALLGALKDLRAAQQALGKLRAVEANMSSALVRKLAMQRCRYEEVCDALSSIEGATDWKEAARTGRAVPEPGVDEEYDASLEGVEEAQQALNEYLAQVRQSLGCREISYVGVNKDSHLLEVPEAAAKKASSSEYELVGNRKGYKRFTSRKLQKLVKSYDEASERKENALACILSRLVARFVADKALWAGVVEAVAELDALMSLAMHAMSPPDGGPMCRPRLLPPPPPADPEDPGSAPTPRFAATNMRHPAGLGGRDNGAFVPNSVQLGAGGREDGAGACPPFILLSGPNMGGKSTLLRQVCLATIMAQVGACVPADSLELSPADAIFVRMGARDSIMTGQSTFFVELAETAAMLGRATRSSLVALDELGRGTATLDGAAVAGAVLQHLAHSTRCRGLFATHYHQLSQQHENDPQVAVMHMACAVAGSPDDAPPACEAQPAGEEVTFLYRLTKGACPKSYGTNVARLAGLPPAVVARAAQMASQRDTIKQACVAAGDAAEEQDAMEVDDTAAVRAAGPAADVAELVAAVRQAACAAQAAAADSSDGGNSLERVLQLQRRAVELLAGGAC